MDTSEDQPDTFRVGHLLEDVGENDKELVVDVFIPAKEPLQFKKDSVNHTIIDLAVVQQVTVTVVKSTGKSKKAPEIIKISK